MTSYIASQKCYPYINCKQQLPRLFFITWEDLHFLPGAAMETNLHARRGTCLSWDCISQNTAGTLTRKGWERLCWREEMPFSRFQTLVPVPPSHREGHSQALSKAEFFVFNFQNPSVGCTCSKIFPLIRKGLSNKSPAIRCAQMCKSKMPLQESIYLAHIVIRLSQCDISKIWKRFAHLQLLHFYVSWKCVCLFLAILCLMMSPLVSCRWHESSAWNVLSTTGLGFPPSYLE